MAGNLNVNANTTLVENTGTLNLTGNLTNADTVLFTTGAMNIGGTFTNNGYYAYGTGTATFNGSANAQVTGSNAPTFYNLTLNKSAATDTLFLTHPIAVNNTLTITQGLLDCEGNQLTNSTTPPISISPSTVTICNGASTTLTASGASTYIWSPRGSLSASTGTSVTATPSVTTTYSVVGSSGNKYQCAVSSGSSGIVTVNTTPTVSVSPSPTGLCFGSPDTVTASGASTYTWSPSTNLSVTTGATVIATPTTAITYTVTGTGSDGCTNSHSAIVNVTSNVTTSCSGAIALRSGVLDTDFAFQPCENSQWYSFVADSAKMLVEVVKPILVADTPMTHIDSLVLYSGTCGSLSVIGTSINNHIDPYDSLPAILANLTQGQTYYIKVTRFPAVWSSMSSYFGLVKNIKLHKRIPSCTLSACDTNNILVNGDLELVPSWAGSHPYYQDNSDTFPANHPAAGPSGYALKSSNMRYDDGTFGGGFSTCPPPINGGDFTDIYMITKHISAAGFNQNPEHGLWFMAFDCPSAACAECYSIPKKFECDTLLNTGKFLYTCNAWQETVNVIPGATYVFSSWLETLDLPSKSFGATVTIAINGGNPFFIDDLDSAYKNWTNICSNWTAPSGVDTANILIQGQGDNFGSADGYDFGLDNLSLKLAALPPITVNSPSICPGTSATLSVSAAYSNVNYTWAPSTGLSATTGSSVNANPSTTTTYTVTETVGTCTYSTTGVVTVYTAPTVTVSPTSANFCLPSGSSSLTASGATSYVWAPAAGLSTTTGTSVTATPTLITTYTVTGTGSHGCTNTATTVITPSVCCSCASGTTITYSVNTTASSIGLSSITSACAYIHVPKLIIDQNVTISGSDVAIAPGTLIDVLNGVTLTINSNSRLYSCDSMWDGIVVEETTSGTAGQLYVSNGSIIEDADTAIYAPPTSTYTPPTISVVNSYLQNNFYDIYINGYSSTTTIYPFTLQGTFLTTGTDGTFSGPTLKSPHSSEITYEGIRINNVTNKPVIIGTSGSNSYTNLFSNMNYGVYDSNANCEVYNNEFSELFGHTSSCHFPCTPPPAIGIGVLAKASASATCGLNVGSSVSSYQYNTFHNVYEGVVINDYVHTSIRSNVFTNDYDVPGAVGKQIGSFAVYAAVNKTILMEVDSNSITNFTVGIQLDRTLVRSTNNTNDVKYNIISVNTSTVTPYNPTGTSSVMNIGIKIENTTQSAFAPTRIFANTVHNANNCIWVSNINNSKVSILSPQLSLIDSNKDIRVAGIKGITGAENSGIRVEDCYGNFNSNIIVQDNGMIYASNTYTLTPTAPSDTEVVGINVLHSQKVYEYCNHIDSIGECMRFTGNCTNQHVYDNVFDEYGPSYDGLVLWTNAQIGPQGIPTSQTMGDMWYNSSSFLRSETFTDGSANVSLYSTLYVNSSSPYNPGLYPSLNGAVNPIGNKFTTSGGTPSIVTTAYSALSCPTSCSSCTNNHSPVIDSMVMDSMHYPMYAPYAYRMDEQFVFDSIAADTGVMTGDTVLRKFYNTNVSTNIGALNVINNYINTGYTTEAASALSSFTPADTIEANYKTVDSIYVYYIGLGTYTVDSADLAHLYNIAYQCPQMGGMAVYEARAMLNIATQSDWEFSDSCTTAGGRVGHKHISPPVNTTQPIPVTAVNAKVYPNPVSTLLNVEVGLLNGQTGNICMYSSLGEKVVCEEITQRITTLPINTLVAGIYYYRITDENGKLIRADKVMIVH